MFKGFVLSESLKKPTFLNNFRKICVRVQEHPESPEVPFWHLFKIEVNDEEINQVAEQFAIEIKNGWYAHFWNNEVVYIIFYGEVFKIPREVRWSSEEFQQVKKYGVEHGVKERYLDFWIED